MVQDTEGVDDLFMAGETVRSQKNITGSAHLAGRKIVSTGDVGGDAYLAGMDVSLDGKVSGDVTVSGYSIQVGEVAGDLRMSGSKLVISGPVSGYALIAGEEVRLEAAIKGDVSLSARKVSFADGAKIDGKLTVYEEKTGEIEIPSQVIPAERVDRRDISEWSEVTKGLKVWDWRVALLQFLIGVIVIAGIAALIAAIAPQKLADLRRGILERPFRTLWFGILAESAVVGSTIILMMTVIGLLLAPATVFITLIFAFAGYIVAAYAFGVALLMAAGKQEPNSIGSRAIAAGGGALAAGLIAMIPFIGWLFVLSLALTGVGSIVIWLFRPKFFASAEATG
ncbi:polymer-forming cytoskeletal protein [Amylibacter sp. SFDW26]|uniref:polymer-forming cytoskeletal protein n=1 Tax=Amylibacter sp. SFDW26 TaxID=2652722 RepID=UPI00126211FB|nr:polymer-forming cytoskeletal protein [Amylibacter sp. SFDW26]KAB7614445.1 polymer-forming cytoskeletal protein [Amylibacter sp. SFDW26]